MNSLKDLEADVAMEVPEAAGTALKALARGEADLVQQREAYRFILHELAGVDRLGFALPGDSETMAWRNGRRFVGLQMARIVAAPMDEAATPLPRARTITEQVRRRREGAS
jgi:hypothetical protein